MEMKMHVTFHHIILLNLPYKFYAAFLVIYQVLIAYASQLRKSISQLKCVWSSIILYMNCVGNYYCYGKFFSACLKPKIFVTYVSLDS